MNIICLGLTYQFILALSVWKSCLGQTIDVKGLQAKNGTIAEITWTITLSKDQLFMSFQASKDSTPIIYLQGNTLILYPEVLDGKLKNVTSTVNPDVVTIKMLYGPVDQIKDNGFKIRYQVITNKGPPAIKAVQLEVTTFEPTAPPTGKPTPDVGTIVGAIIGGLLGVVIIGVIVYFVIRWKSKPLKISNSERKSALGTKDEDGTHERQYSSMNEVIPQSLQTEKPLYAPLGQLGGRVGPRDEPVRSNYAEAKTDKHGYPVSGSRFPNNRDESGVGEDSGLVV